MRNLHTGHQQRGMVLVTSLLLLIVVTVLAMAMFKSFGLDEKVAGNTRDKQRALQAAISAEQFAEWWLINGNTAAPVTCSAAGALASSSTGISGQICSNVLTTSATGGVTAVPWKIGGASVGVPYTPPGMNTTTSGNTFYSSAPAFYISYLGTSSTLTPSPTPSSPGLVFQIDAVGWGGSATTAAVVESTFVVSTTTFQSPSQNP